MIEILRESPQPTLTLILFLVIVFIYIFLYNYDARRLRYFFWSLFNKQYQVNYGRQSKVSEYFMILLSLTSLLSASFLLSVYLGYCSEYTSYSFLFLYSGFIILSFLLIKWAALFLLSLLFKQDKLFQEFRSLSVQYTNLFFSPIVLATIYMYLIGALSQNSSSLLISIALTLIILSKMKVLAHMRKGASLGVSYIILYLCTFEIVPFLWLLIGLNC